MINSHEYFPWLAVIVFLGFIADCIFGDPVYVFHPVRIMGNVISAADRLLRNKKEKNEKKNKAADFIAGAVLSVLMVAAAYIISFALLFFLYKIHLVLGLAVELGFCYQIFAAKALKAESMKVYRELAKGDIAQARIYLSYIVGRETENLNVEQISKAAVETVAENLSDGVIAPMMYMLVGGAPLGFAYKAISTLDSMIGYNDEKYAYFGKFAARMDDIANFLPSRISAMLMILAASACRLGVKQAWKIFVRDRYNHKSPNSAQTESVCAGALGISLSGDNYYKGVLVEKPAIGDALRPAEKEDIKLANKLMYATAWMAILIGIGIRVIVCVL